MSDPLAGQNETAKMIRTGEDYIRSLQGAEPGGLVVR